jgi:hypothetical protein
VTVRRFSGQDRQGTWSAAEERRVLSAPEEMCAVYRDVEGIPPAEGTLRLPDGDADPSPRERRRGEER